MDGLELFMNLLAGYVIVVIALLVAAYAISSVAYKRALEAIDYAHPRLVWIPLVRQYALAEAMDEADLDQVLPVKIPKKLFCFWWLIAGIAYYIPVVGAVVFFVLQTVCMGAIFVILFAKLEDRDFSQEYVIGFISGFIPLIGIFKLLMIGKKSK